MEEATSRTAKNLRVLPCSPLRPGADQPRGRTRAVLPFLAGATALVTLAAALVVRVFARSEFDSFGESVWWAAQTVTTVGYGGVIPQTAFSKSVAVLVMFFGIAAPCRS